MPPAINKMPKNREIEGGIGKRGKSRRRAKIGKVLLVKSLSKTPHFILLNAASAKHEAERSEAKALLQVRAPYTKLNSKPR